MKNKLILGMLYTLLTVIYVALLPPVIVVGAVFYAAACLLFFLDELITSEIRKFK